VKDRNTLQCPFLKQACIENRCALFARIAITAPGPIVGTAQTQNQAGCTLPLILVLLGHLISITPPPRPVVRPPHN